MVGVELREVIRTSLKKKNPHKAADGDTKEHPSEDAKSVQEDSSSDVEQPPSTKTS